MVFFTDIFVQEKMRYRKQTQKLGKKIAPPAQRCAIFRKNTIIYSPFHWGSNAVSCVTVDPLAADTGYTPWMAL
jgi:hypothetical protein